jgi:phospholipid/cholesterol/gamma-HCH transport system substrate-binding protein
MAFINKEVKIGIIAILALAILYIGFIFLKGINLFSDTNVYYVKLINIDGLAPQSDVIVSGMKIGSVGDFEYNHAENNIIVSIEVNKDFYIAKGSTASLAKEMLGSTKLEINMPEGTNSYLQSGDTIVSRREFMLKRKIYDQLVSWKKNSNRRYCYVFLFPL